jgi:ATP phosphoribosyltransferase regulatory subunit HisZ
VCWTDGETPDVPVAGPDGPADGFARDLADFVRALDELQVPPDALTDPALRCYRGEPLAAMDATTRDYLADCRQLPGLDLDCRCVNLPQQASRKLTIWPAATYREVVIEDLLSIVTDRRPSVRE